MLKSSIITIALLVMSVAAYDFRLDYKPRKGQTVDEFCKLWTSECKKVTRGHKGEIGYLCEANVPKAGEVAVFCDVKHNDVYTQYTVKVAKKLGATAV